mmetsp:Transcript_58774/g.164051  ORF Transcript_58774/g.164051 Transcript_58774/m.164051 type:complete len:204 (-) Transcript_58774:514-1125(-)
MPAAMSRKRNKSIGPRTCARGSGAIGWMWRMPASSRMPSRPRPVMSMSSSESEWNSPHSSHQYLPPRETSALSLRSFTQPGQNILHSDPPCTRVPIKNVLRQLAQNTCCSTSFLSSLSFAATYSSNVSVRCLPTRRCATEAFAKFFAAFRAYAISWPANLHGTIEDSEPSSQQAQQVNVKGSPHNVFRFFDDELAGGGLATTC